MNIGNRKIAFLGVVLVLLSPVRAKTESIGAGPGSLTFSFSQGVRVVPIRVWTFGPPRMGPDTRILFVMHGRERNAHGYLSPWMAPAHRANVLVLAPEFSKQFFRGNSYNLGLLDPVRSKRERVSGTAFTAIERIFDHVVWLTGIRNRQYRIYGHSAGAQFVHRLILFIPDARAEVAVAANAGWYTMPDFNSEFPYGLKNSGATTEGLAKSLRKKLIVLLGEKDNDPGHSSLNRQPGAMNQGRTRLERGRNFFRSAEGEAQAQGVRLGWEIKTVPGVAHDHSAMSEAAAPLLIKKDAGK